MKQPCFCLVASAVALLLVSQAHAQSTWVARPPNFTAVAFGNNTFVATGAAGEIATSPDGATWQLQNSGTTNALNTVAFGNGLFVAAGDNGTLLTSPDAVTWTARTSGTTATISGVAFGAGRFVAVGADSAFPIRTSTDGIAWTSISAPGPLTAVAFGHTSAGVDTFVAVGDNGTVFSSANGSAWTAGTSGTTKALFAVTFGNGLFVAVGDAPGSSSAVLITSSDGHAWSNRNAGAQNPLRAVAFGAGTFVTAGDAFFLANSTDGINWHTVPGTANPLYGDVALGGLAFGNNTFVAVGLSGTILSSLNSAGTLWEIWYFHSTQLLNGIVFGANRFVAVGYAIQTSADGGLWAWRNSGTTNRLQSVAYGNGTFVAVGADTWQNQGVIVTSPDSDNWTKRTLANNVPLHGVTFANGLFVAVGTDPNSGGTIQTSPDGMTWAEQKGGGPLGFGDLEGVGYGTNQFVAVGFSGVLTSPDGTNWTQVYNDSQHPLSSVAYGNGTFVAVGIYPFAAGKMGVIVTSPDGAQWTPQADGQFDGLFGVTFAGNTFVAVGKGNGAGGTVITSTNGLDWSVASAPVPDLLYAVAFGGNHFVAVGNAILTSTASTGGLPALPPIGSFSVSTGGTPILSSNPWEFTATYSTLVAGLKLRVQSTTTTNSEGSWADLPGNPYMTNLNSNWSLNTTGVPTGNQYFRVIASATGYRDSVSASAGPYTVLSPTIGPLMYFGVNTPLPYRTGKTWVFGVIEDSVISGLSLRVQWSATTNVESSWTDVPGGTMSPNGVAWYATTTDVPTGTVWFRVVASAPGYPDRISDPIGPVTIGEGLPAIASFTYSTIAPIRSNNPWTFRATYSTLVSALTLRVQSTTTTNIESSWTDLPGNPYMTHLDANWTLNTTDVPTGDQYFRVVASAPGYADALSTTIIGPITVLAGIAPFGDFSWETLSPHRTGTPWVFSIVEWSAISGLNLRLQSSPTPDVETSWTDLSGGQMTRSPNSPTTWVLPISNLPTGTVYFRVVASAPNYSDQVSRALGPFDIGPALPVVTKTYSTSTTVSLDGLAETYKQEQLNVVAAGQAILHLFLGNNSANVNVPVTLAAQPPASTIMTVGSAQTLIVPGMAVGLASTLVDKGTIKGTASLIGSDGAGLIGSDSASLIGSDSASFAHDQATAKVVSNEGGSVVGPGGASFHPDSSSVADSVPAPRRVTPKGPGPTQPSFTGLMTVDGNYYQFAGTLFIGVAGTNTTSQGAQQFDQLVVSGTANLFGGSLTVGLFNPDDQTNRAVVFQPPNGSTFDVVVASNIAVTSSFTVRGSSVWGDGLFFDWGIVTRPDGLQALRLVAAPYPPILTLQRAGSMLQLSYPTNYAGYTVQSTPTLSTTNWTTFSTGTNVVMLDFTNDRQFFRLSKP